MAGAVADRGGGRAARARLDRVVAWCRSPWNAGVAGVLALGALWWAVTVWMLATGQERTGSFGFGAWRSSFEQLSEANRGRWAWVGVVAVVGSLLVLGGVLAVHGRRALPWVLGALAALTALAWVAAVVA